MAKNNHFQEILKDFEVFIPHLIAKYLFNPEFNYTTLDNKDVKFVLRSFHQNLNGVRELRDFYEWAHIRHNWTTEKLFASHKSWKHFMTMYKEKDKAKHLVFKILCDIQKNIIDKR